MKILYMFFAGLFLLSAISYGADTFTVPGGLDFGSVNQGTGKSLPLGVTNVSGAVISLKASIGPAGVPFSINLTSFSLGANNNAIIAVSLRNDALPGQLSARLSFPK